MLEAGASDGRANVVDVDLLTPEVVERINRLLGGRAPHERRLVAVPTILSVGPEAVDPPPAQPSNAIPPLANDGAGPNAGADDADSSLLSSNPLPVRSRRLGWRWIAIAAIGLVAGVAAVSVLM